MNQQQFDGERLPCGCYVTYWRPRDLLNDTHPVIWVWEGRCDRCGALIDEVYEADGALIERRLMD